VTSPSDPFPSDLAAAHATILAQCELLTLAKSEVTVGRLEIERLKLMLAKARREQYGQSSERGRLVEQLELAIEDLEEAQAEQETKAEIAAPAAAREKRANHPRPARRPLPVPAGRYKLSAFKGAANATRGFGPVNQAAAPQHRSEIPDLTMMIKNLVMETG
jgi:Transposase C of IS166 homeodomain